MPRTTRNVEISELRDLLGRPGRAALGSVRDGNPVVVPALLHWTEGRWRVGIDPSQGSPPAAGDEVVLVVDEGRQFFDLRAAYVRGPASPTDRPDQAREDLLWIEVIPAMAVGWDYGQMRYATDELVSPDDSGSAEQGSDGRP